MAKMPRWPEMERKQPRIRDTRSHFSGYLAV